MDTVQNIKLVGVLQHEKERMHTATLWNVSQCSLHKIRSFGAPATSCFLVRLIFDPKYGGDNFLRNVGSHMDYAALYTRRWQHS
jgi:hypothetical protein